MKEIIGITTTIPVEIIFASGNIPKDLNNIFITDETPIDYVESAEINGFSRNMCAWIKGIYSAVKKHNIKTVVAVTEGDCSNSNSLIEILRDEGVNVISFAYPYSRDKNLLTQEIEKFSSYFNVSKDEIAVSKIKCDEARKLAHEIDRMTWNDNVVTGKENHLWLINTSDFMSDLDLFKDQANEFISKCKKREKKEFKHRIGYIGIPPIVSDIYDFVEENNARVVFNEIQRQFAMPKSLSLRGAEDNIIEQYYNFTYPYSIFGRLKDIQQQIKTRNLTGLIHYTQSFCHRQMDDIILRKYIDIPIITLECDKPGVLSSRNKMKLETFLGEL